jgi:hypothetical protein
MEATPAVVEAPAVDDEANTSSSSAAVESPAPSETAAADVDIGSGGDAPADEAIAEAPAKENDPPPADYKKKWSSAWGKLSSSVSSGASRSATATSAWYKAKAAPGISAASTKLASATNSASKTLSEKMKNVDMKESLGNAKTKMVESAKSLKEKASTAVSHVEQ